MAERRQEAEDYFQRPRSNENLPVRSRGGTRSAVPPLPGSPNPSSPGGAPRTPLLGRPLSSQFNSPGQVYRSDDEVYVLELGTRFLRIGFGGEALPKCCMSFGPETQRRAGDLTRWVPLGEDEIAIKEQRRPGDNPDTWTRHHELYQSDLREQNLGVVSDKVERAMRAAITDSLLVMDESKRRTFILAIPPIMPRSLLSTIITSLFKHPPIPAQITLMSSPSMCTVSAGLRSALVVDIGWSETVVTAIYELREVRYWRNDRGAKRLNWEVAKMLVKHLDRDAESRGGAKSKGVTFSECEEVIHRLVWCRPAVSTVSRRTSAGPNDHPVRLPIRSQDPLVPNMLSIPFARFSDPAEAAFLGIAAPELPPTSQPPSPKRTRRSMSYALPSSDLPPATPAATTSGEPSVKFDDHEIPLPMLIFQSLLQLPPDIRGTLLPRIVFVGGGSEVSGLKTRLLSEVSNIIRSRGWDVVNNYGSATGKLRTKRTSVCHAGPHVIAKGSRDTGSVRRPSSADTSDADMYTNRDIDPQSSAEAYQQPPLPDPILARLQRTEATSSRMHSAQLSSKTSLGAWAGASLLAGLRVKGAVEIDRDTFLANGFRGAETDHLGGDMQGVRRSKDQEEKTKRQSVAPGAAKAGERTSAVLTLGQWA